ncbi:hypothetical protein D3C87_1481560 [compost metagenome]
MTRQVLRLLRKTAGFHRQRRHDAQNRTGRISHHGETADLRDILRRTPDRTALFREKFCRGVHIVNADITGPVGRNALALVFFGQFHDAAHAFAIGFQHQIGHFRRTEILGLPAGDMTIEAGTLLHVRRHQFNPYEFSVCIGH